MGKAKGSEKTGGRASGTPNKITSSMKELISKFIGDYQLNQFVDDFSALDSKERVDVFLKLLSFVVPKPQAVDINASVAQSNGPTIEQRLIELSGEFIDDDTKDDSIVE